ncbi:hypothetical protein M0R04_14255 [Candidatus Dojkabacteria bacterium]|jgi:hypothetical protein|nr:hypothetical protein [Candidatus Dojkabacteria bacterium]
MKTALLIPFYRYTPRVGEYYRVYFEQLLKGLALWGDEVDKVYLIDQEWNFSPEDIDRLRAVKPDSEIIHSGVTGHHREQFKFAIPYVKEDTILFLDNDVIIWERGIVSGWFKQAEKADIVTAFDGSGGLKEQVQAKFPILQTLDATRMGSYYFILHKEIFDRIPDFDFAPQTYPAGTYIKELDYVTKEGDWSDSFGLFTIKLLALNPKVGQIYDDRSSISIIGNTGEPKRLKYYHVRNGNLPIYTLASKISHIEDYQRTLKITPISELTRLFGWFDILSPYHKEILEVMKDVDISEEEWNSYIREFRIYHNI